MNLYFSQPWLLLLITVYAAFVWRQWRISRHRAGSSALLRRRGNSCAALHAAGALCLILAAAGLQYPAHTAQQMIVIAADVSESVFDLPTQSTRLRELIKGLDHNNTRLGVVAFGGTAGIERQVQAMESSQAEPAAPESRRRRNAFAQSTVPDLSRLSVVVDRSATDLAGAVNFSRGLFPAAPDGGGRAILLLSDFRNTRGNAQAAAAALRGSGIDLLASAAVLGPAADVHVASVRVPESSPLGRALPIEVAVASQSPCAVQVSVWREKAGTNPTPVDSRTVTLEADAGRRGAELRRVVTFIDHPDSPGIAVYTARLSGVDGQIANDVSLNNQLSTAARVTAPARWAVLTRSGSTLDRMCADAGRPLGVEARAFDVSALPQLASDYDPFVGILVDGLSSVELADDAAMHALSGAVDSGKALVAVGGDKAFGAGGHREGPWEKLLPVEMTPEDDRTRSVLFLIDVSKSMDQKMGRDGSGVRKIDFAAEQLAQAVQKLKPLDRLGLITFSGTAHVAAPISSDPSRSGFLNAVKSISIQANTDLSRALSAAADALKNDDAEEQLVVLLSDGVQTVPIEPEKMIDAARQLCPRPAGASAPRRTTLYTFGIGVDPSDSSDSGEKLLKALAEAGGGVYSPQFLKLAERLEKAFEAEKKDFYLRREPFALRAAIADHPLLAQAAQWPVLPFRNRVKAKPATETLLLSGAAQQDKAPSKRADPVLVLSGSLWSGASRRAVLAASLDGAAGAAFLASPGTQRLLPSLLDWAEARKEASLSGWHISAEPRDDDTIEIEVRARDSVSHLPANGRRPVAILSAVQVGAQDGPLVKSLPTAMMHPSAPGIYRAILPAPPRGVYRLTIQENNTPIYERFVSLPYPAELRRFGTDRAAMQNLVVKAGGESRVIENARDLVEWAAQKQMARAPYSLRPWLVLAGVLLLLLEFAARGRRA